MKINRIRLATFFSVSIIILNRAMAIETPKHTFIKKENGFEVREYGSMIIPTRIAVAAAPNIIIIQVMVAAAAFLCSEVWVARRANNDVPAAPTPTPISEYAIIEVITPK